MNSLPRRRAVTRLLAPLLGLALSVFPQNSNASHDDVLPLEDDMELDAGSEIYCTAWKSGKKQSGLFTDNFTFSSLGLEEAKATSCVKCLRKKGSCNSECYTIRGYSCTAEFTRFKEDGTSASTTTLDILFPDEYSSETLPYKYQAETAALRACISRNRISINRGTGDCQVSGCSVVRNVIERGSCSAAR